jgi:hypothetical protein
MDIYYSSVQKQMMLPRRCMVRTRLILFQNYLGAFFYSEDSGISSFSLHGLNTLLAPFIIKWNKTNINIYRSAIRSSLHSYYIIIFVSLPAIAAND